MTAASTPRGVAEGSPRDSAHTPATGQPAASRPPSSTARRVLRAAIGSAAAIAAFFSAAVVFVAGAIVTSGCFIECTEPDPLAGVPILVLAGALFALGLAGLWWGFINRHWRRAWMTIGILSAVATVALLSAVTSTP